MNSQFHQEQVDDGVTTADGHVVDLTIDEEVTTTTKQPNDGSRKRKTELQEQQQAIKIPKSTSQQRFPKAQSISQVKADFKSSGNRMLQELAAVTTENAILQERHKAAQSDAEAMRGRLESTEKDKRIAGIRFESEQQSCLRLQNAVDEMMEERDFTRQRLVNLAKALREENERLQARDRTIHQLHAEVKNLEKDLKAATSWVWSD